MDGWVMHFSSAAIFHHQKLRGEIRALLKERFWQDLNGPMSVEISADGDHRDWWEAASDSC